MSIDGPATSITPAAAGPAATRTLIPGSGAPAHTTRRAPGPVAATHRPSASAAASTLAADQPFAGSTMVTAKVASASPYAGQKAWERKPAAAVAAAKTSKGRRVNGFSAGDAHP